MYFCCCLKKASCTVIQTHTFKKGMGKREKQKKREKERRKGKEKMGNGERGKERAEKDKGTCMLFPKCPIFHS